MNLPLDAILTPIQDDSPKDDFYIRLLDLLEVDPGNDLVAKIMDRIEEIG